MEALFSQLAPEMEREGQIAGLNIGRYLGGMGINVDDNPQSVVPEVLKELKIDFPIFRDSEDGELSDLFDVHAIPMTVIVNKARKVVYVENGERDWYGNDIRDQLDRWLKE